jgi:LmbE family N-acetylglucosaminyl deacetylase
MKVLIIAPHPDDEVIGCGGTIRLRVEQGDEVAVAFLTSGELGLKHLPAAKARQIREHEAKRAAQILGAGNLFFLRQPDWTLGDHMKSASKALKEVLSSEKPRAIYLPHPTDGHPDHRATLPILRVALKNRSGPRPQLLGYEIWTPLTVYDVVMDISKVMTRKLRALRSHASQLNEFDYVKAVTGLNQYRGELAGTCRFAEVFQTISPDC